MSSLSAKSALVLGGSRGIGAAIVRRLARDGATVAFTYGGSKDAAERLAADTGTTTSHLDSADASAVAAFVKSRERLDILVINAGVAMSGDPRELDPAAVDRMIDINIRAPYYAAAAAGHAMSDGGRIVILGSVSGARNPHPGTTAYAMTKAAMQGLARGLSRDFGPRAITVNVVQPGPVDTDMNPADGPMKAMMHEPMSIKRHATADEIAGMVAYLVGPEASLVTGAMHTIDGGYSA